MAEREGGRLMRSKSRRWLCGLLAILMVLAGLPGAYAADGPAGWRAWADHAAADPVTATKADVYEAFGWPVEYLWDGMDGRTPADAGDVLYSLSRTWGVLKTDTGYTYPAGDGPWMSAAEWAELSGDLSRAVPRGILAEIDRRTEVCSSALEEMSGIKSADAYVAALEVFCPEFSILAGSNRDAVAYWLGRTDGGLDAGDGKFASVLHELAHEASARLSGGFLSRKADGNTWSVLWDPGVREIHPYDVLRHESVGIRMARLPETWDLVDAEAVPEAVRTLSGYESYFAETSAANVFGAYGMLEEFCTETVELRYRVVSTAMGRGRRSFCLHDLRGIYFWDGALGCYLRALREQRPELYRDLMADGSFAGVLSDTCACVDEQISLIRVRDDPACDGELAELAAWAEDQGVRALLAEETASSGTGIILPRLFP